jgi:hypothetical protein
MMHALTGVNALLKMFYTTKEIIGNFPKMNRLKNINLFVKMIENRCFMHHNLDAFALCIFGNRPVNGGRMCKEKVKAFTER